MYVYITVHISTLSTYVHCDTAYSIRIHVHVHTTYNYIQHSMYVCSNVCMFICISCVLCIQYILCVHRYNKALLWK